MNYNSILYLYPQPHPHHPLATGHVYLQQPWYAIQRLRLSGVTSRPLQPPRLHLVAAARLVGAPYTLVTAISDNYG